MINLDDLHSHLDSAAAIVAGERDSTKDPTIARKMRRLHNQIREVIASSERIHKDYLIGPAEKGAKP